MQFFGVGTRRLKEGLNGILSFTRLFLHGSKFEYRIITRV